MSIFYRLTTDQIRTDGCLQNLFAGPQSSACWLIGGGPSLTQLPVRKIRESPLPKMCLNLAGTRLLRPNFWTSYDPTVRFHRSIYLDPGVMKFVHRRRAMDLVPETTFKVCECPNLWFFDRDSQRGYSPLFSQTHTKIVDWADSFVQALDILFQLGFRKIYLAGCEMIVRPSAAQTELAAAKKIESEPLGLLADFVKRCEVKGITGKQLEEVEPALQYHFPETKPLAAAINTDRHYFRISQFLRLSRRSISEAGLHIISVTPDSRLNQVFPYQPVNRVLKEIHTTVGHPFAEPITGLYSRPAPRPQLETGPMQDLPSPQQTEKQKSAKKAQPKEAAKQEAELLVEQEGFVAVAEVRKKLEAVEQPTPCEEG